jgi:hypothetical protein
VTLGFISIYQKLLPVTLADAKPRAYSAKPCYTEEKAQEKEHRPAKKIKAPCTDKLHFIIIWA